MQLPHPVGAHTPNNAPRSPALTASLALIGPWVVGKSLAVSRFAQRGFMLRLRKAVLANSNRPPDCSTPVAPVVSPAQQHKAGSGLVPA